MSHARRYGSMLSVDRVDDLVNNHNKNIDVSNDIANKLKGISDRELQSDYRTLSRIFDALSYVNSINRSEIENRRAYKRMSNDDEVHRWCLRHYTNFRSNDGEEQSIWEAVRLTATMIEMRCDGNLMNMCRDLGNDSDASFSLLCVVLCKLTNGSN